MDNLNKSPKTPNLKLLLILVLGFFILLPLIIFLVSKIPSSEDATQASLDQKIAAESEAYTSKYPITSILPHVGEGFRVDYGLCETSSKEFCVRVSALSSGLKNALDFLLSLEETEGFTIEDYSLEFPDFISPFSKDPIEVSSLDLKNLEGNYYGALLSYENYEGTRITYRLPLEKTGSTYKILAEPKLLFSYSDLSLPKSAISKLNRL